MIQLGTRWSVGDDAPSSLPQAVVDAVLDVEADLSEEGVDVSDWKWTLTWLEGRPVVELDADPVIEYAPTTDLVTVTPGE